MPEQVGSGGHWHGQLLELELLELEEEELEVTRGPMDMEGDSWFRPPSP